jgi:4-amino-4-deoxy-L-arabinose transferase-like glycosyltransferase
MTAGALCLRVIVIVISKNEPVGGDGFYYWSVANQNAAGHWFLSPYTSKATALHPPVWTLILSIWALLGNHGLLRMQLLAATLGAVAVTAVGFAGRRVGGDRVGLLAAGIAAVYAGFWVYERALLSETFLFVVIAGTLIVAYWFHDRPSPWGAVLLGGMAGLLALTRSEQILDFPLLVVPLIWSTRLIRRRLRVAWMAMSVAALLIVVAPWTIYNLGRFQRPVFLSTNGGIWVAGNCNGAYAGPRIGFYDCRLRDAPKDESFSDTKALPIAASYAKHHLSRLPLVVFAREGRAFGYWNPFQQAMLDNAWQHVSPFFGAPTSVWVYDLRLISYWILLAPAVVGAVVLRRRRVLLYPLLAFVATIVITVALTYGETRYRAAAEVTLVILAAAGIDAILPSHALAGAWYQTPGAPTDVE